MAEFTVNNVAYSWSMITLTSPNAGIDEEMLTGVSGIKWNVKKNVKTNYGLGGQPVNRGFGNTEYEASITLDYNAQVKLRGLRGSLTNLGEFDLIVSFANEFGSDDWTTETITLKGCLFTEDGMEAKQDDTNITKDFELNPFRIEISRA